VAPWRASVQVQALQFAAWCVSSSDSPRLAQGAQPHGSQLSLVVRCCIPREGLAALVAMNAA
jgi:hypothetical protein